MIMITQKLFDYDRQYLPKIIAGIDEAGRGPLAGPVVCAACIMPLTNMIDKINDSKQVTGNLRESLYRQIIDNAICYNISILEHNIIDEINILNATKLAMKNAVEGLSIAPQLVLIDAVKLDINFEQLSIIKGDATSYNIAAASILAKVTRDKIMCEFDKKYPEYGFCRHKGYGTAAHIEALKKYGKCEIHRNTFIKNFKSHL